MKTPIQELIETLVSIKSRIPQELYFEKGMRMGIGSCIKEAKAMLEKEKEVIVRSFMNVSDNRDTRLEDVHLREFAKEYYNQTFKTKER